MFRVVKMKVLVCPLVFVMSSNMSCQPREPVMPGCNKTQEDGAGWELRESK